MHMRQDFDLSRDGFVIAKNVLSESDATRLESLCDKVLSIPGELGKVYEPDGFESRVGCILLEPEFLPFLSHEGYFPAVVDYLGCDLHLIKSQVIYRHPLNKNYPRVVRTPQNHGWHRDQKLLRLTAGSGNLPLCSVKAFIYLNDLTAAESGSTLFIRGSHREDYQIIIEEGEINPKEFVRPVVGRGDVIIFDCRTYHAGESNFSAFTRKAFAFEYGLRWLMPLDRFSNFTDDKVKLSDLERQLLGITTDFLPNGSYKFQFGSNPLRKWKQTRNTLTSAVC